MAGQPENMGEGIRFLDETPEPVKPSPPRTSDPKRKQTPKQKRKEWPVGLISFLAVVIVGIVWKATQEEAITVREVFEERFEVNDAPRIEVEAVQGSVRVRRGAEGVVSCRVEAEGKGRTAEEAGQSLGRLRPIMRPSADGLSVRIGGIEAREPGAGGVLVRLEVPDDAQVRVVTGKGSVRVKDVRGSVAARTSLGKIEVQGAEGPIVLDSKNGSIEVEAREALVLATTSNGTIRFKGSLADGTSRMVTSNGSVTLRLPKDQAILVDAQAGNGRVSSDFPTGRVEPPSGVIPVGFEEEPREARVAIRTANGSIKVEKN